MLAAVLDHMRDRLEAGARADLLEMAQVTYVKGWTARLLRENGYKGLRALAEADPKDLVPVLTMACSGTRLIRDAVLMRLGEPTEIAQKSTASDRGRAVFCQVAC